MEEAPTVWSDEIELGRDEQAQRRERNRHQTSRGHLGIMEEVYMGFTGRDMADLGQDSNIRFGNTLLRVARFQRGRSLLRLPKRFDKQPQISGHIGEGGRTRTVY